MLLMRPIAIELSKIYVRGEEYLLGLPITSR